MAMAISNAIALVELWPERRSSVRRKRSQSRTRRTLSNFSPTATPPFSASPTQPCAQMVTLPATTFSLSAMPRCSSATRSKKSTLRCQNSRTSLPTTTEALIFRSARNKTSYVHAQSMPSGKNRSSESCQHRSGTALNHCSRLQA